MAQRTFYNQNVVFLLKAMSAPRYCELRDDACSDVETSANVPRFSYPYVAMNFHGRMTILNDDLSIDTAFSKIDLVEQYL